MFSGFTPLSIQYCAASVSRGMSPSPSKTVKASLSLSRPRYSGLVRNSQLQAIISFLK